MSDDVAVVQRLFAAVEDRDLDGLLACYSDDVEITEADALPYGGVWRGPGVTFRARGKRVSTGGSGVTGRAQCVRCFAIVPSTQRRESGSTPQRSASTAFAMTASYVPRCFTPTPRPSLISSKGRPVAVIRHSDKFADGNVGGRSAACCCA